MKYIQVGKGKIRLVGKCGKLPCHVCQYRKASTEKCNDMFLKSSKVQSEIISIKSEVKK